MPTPKKKKGIPVKDKSKLKDLSAVPVEETKEDLTKVGSGIKKNENQAQKTVDSDLDALNAEIDANFRMAYDAEREWIEEAKEDIRFKSGDQWQETDRAKLALEGRPCLTFNKIKPVVKLLTGHFIQNSARLQVSPEGGEDQKFSSVADNVISHIDEQAALNFNMDYQFAGGQTTGRAYIELLVDYEKDPIFGELKSIYHAQPGVIFPDPRGTSYDLNDDRQFIFKLGRKTKAELKSMYPKKAKEIDEISEDTEAPDTAIFGKEGDANNYGINPHRSKTGIKSSPMSDDEKTLKQFWVKEYWRINYVERCFVYFLDSGDQKKFKSKDEAEKEIVLRKVEFINKGGKEEAFQTIERTRQCKEMHVAIRCGGTVLADDLSPMEPYYSGFTIFQYIADWTPEAEKTVDQIQGIVRCMKDPQREKNKSRSQMLHIINTAANSGWVIDEDAMSPAKQADLKNFGSTPGIVVTKKQGREVTRIEPVPPPIAQQVREKAANDDFKEVTGVNSDLLAIDSQANPSGKAIALRIRQAITILETDFRNFRYTKKLIGTAIMKMVPTLFDVSKLKKILGVSFMQENQIDDIFLKAFLIQIEDLKYNVRIAEQGDTKTLREETFEDLSNMMQNGMQIPFEVFADFMNIPNKQEVINKIQAYQAQQQQAAMAAAQATGKAPKMNGAIPA